ncbi:hypothetical protein ACFY1P_32785 [Streptomyces sp. NPDC001407]|uniref:hypothetical protein n=1 Tax=Streptomyces sp. NPDC001407 TaxID=3364573 RepID=UPI003693D3E6
MSSQGERGAVCRSTAKGAEGWPGVKLTEADRLERARRGELSSRPARVELYVSPITGTAGVRFQDAEGRTHSAGDVTSLPGTRHTSPVSDELTSAALAEIRKRGFQVVRGAYWQHNSDRAHLAIEPTTGYLEYVERRFGPEPVIPQTPGVTFRRAQRGRWIATVSTGETYALTWSPALGGDQWRVWGGPQYTKLIRTATRQEKALFVLKYPAHAHF